MTTTVLHRPIEGVGIDADTALEELYAAHYRPLVRLAVLLLRDQGRAEDVVQDSFVAVYKAWDRLGGDVDAPAYLRQTVVNRCRSTQRHLGVVARHLARQHEEPLGAPADQPSLAADRRRTVLAALSRLPTRQREVLALRYYLDLSEKEIAAALGISQGAVKSHASRGAAALREHLTPPEDSP